MGFLFSTTNVANDVWLASNNSRAKGCASQEYTNSTLSKMIVGDVGRRWDTRWNLPGVGRDRDKPGSRP